MLSNARKELEHFFAADRELEAKYARGDIVNIDYLVKKQHIRTLLGERAPVALHVLVISENFLYHWHPLPRDEQAKKTRAQTVDYRVLKPWLDAIRDKNRERITLSILDTLLSAEIPPVPEVPSEALTRYIEVHGFVADAEGRRAAWIDGTIVIDPVVPPKPPQQCAYEEGCRGGIVIMSDGQNPDADERARAAMSKLISDRAGQTQGRK